MTDKERDYITKELLLLLHQMSDGCGMICCIIKQPEGMAPNGPCRCRKYTIRNKLREIAADLITINDFCPNSGTDEQKESNEHIKSNNVGSVTDAAAGGFGAVIPGSDRGHRRGCPAPGSTEP